MKRLLLAVLLITATAVIADDLVDAAKAAKAKRKKSTTKVITNADVKKAKATLGETKPAEIEVPAGPGESSLEKQARERLERTSSEVRLAAAEKTLAAFEKELAQLEQKYYEENDLDRRDTELVRRFNDVKAKRDAAMKELEALKPPVPETEDPAESRPSP
jgi:Cu/Ag efflux protein CusF